MKKVLSVATCCYVAFLSFLCLAEIPQGQWMKKDIEPGQTWGLDQFLELNFDNPQKIDGKLFYGSLRFPAGSKMDIVEFGMPEGSGNTASFKTYDYVEYFDEDGGLFFNDSVGEGKIIYDEGSKTLKIIINNDYTISFGPSDISNRVISNANNLNIRKAPVTGEKIGTMTMGQTLPLISVSPQIKGPDWYEVRLPDGRSGFVSGDYAARVSPSWLSIPEGLIKPNVSYVHFYEESDPGDTRQTTLDFIRKGDRIMCHYFTGYPLTFRLPIDIFMMGHIEENKIILDHHILPMGSEVDIYEIFESGDFSKFAKHATKDEEPEIFYFDSQYYNGRVLDTSGTEFEARENSVD